jgi:hypothetical protein
LKKLKDEDIPNLPRIFYIYTLTTYFNLFFVWPPPN